MERPIESKKNGDGPKLRVVIQAGILITGPQPLLLAFNQYTIAVRYFILSAGVGI
jgi:hypothetical protein